MNYDKDSFLNGLMVGRSLSRSFNRTYPSFDGQPIPMLDADLYPEDSQALFDASFLIRSYTAANTKTHISVGMYTRSYDQCYAYGTMRTKSVFAFSPISGTEAYYIEKYVYSDGYTAYHTIKVSSLYPSIANAEDLNTGIFYSRVGLGISTDAEDVNNYVPLFTSRSDACEALQAWIQSHPASQDISTTRSLRMLSSSSYDNISFLAGLAVGRALWRPHGTAAAKPDYLTFYAFRIPQSGT